MKNVELDSTVVTSMCGRFTLNRESGEMECLEWPADGERFTAPMIAYSEKDGWHFVEWKR
jgi:hypothetical protein